MMTKKHFLALIFLLLLIGSQAIVKAGDYLFESRKQYDSYTEATIHNKADIEQAIKDKVDAISIPSDVGLFDVTVWDLERIGKALPIKSIDIQSDHPWFIKGSYLRAMPNLESLHMSFATDEAIASIPAKAPLKSLRVTGVTITNKSLAYIGKFTGLQNLSLGSCRISDEGLSQLQQLTQLKDLELAGNKITGTGLRYFSKNSQLKFLELSNNERLNDSAMAALKYFPDLRVLWMTGTSITDAGFMQIAGLKKLERIWFGDTKITDVGMKVFTQLSELTDVSFYRIKVSDAGMQYLSNCKKLDNIHASDVPITDKAIGYWVDLPKLESLSLESTKITDKALSSFKKMPALDTLDVEKTAFSYTAYSQLKNFKKSKAKPVMEHADIVSAPAIFSKCVVLLLESGEVVCLDRSLGKQLWKRKADKADSIVNVKNMLVHINVFPRLAVTALRPDGTVLWSYAGPQAFSSRRVSGGFDSSRLFLFSGEGRVISLDLKNGHLLWDKTIKNTTLCRRVGSFVGREEYLLEQDSKMLYLRGVFGNGSGYGKADTRLLAVEKETGNLAWRSQNVFSESLAVQVFSLAKSGCLLLLSNSDKAQADLFVLDIPTGRLLTQDSLRCRSLSVYDRCPSSEFVMDKMQSSGFYLEPIWGSICKIGSIHIERIKDRAQIVRDQVKYWSWDYLILRDLTDLGLFIGTREGTLLLNPKVLKPICMLPRGHYDNIETIICAEKVQNTAQLVATVYHSKQEHWCKYYSVAEIVALEIPTGKRLWTVRTGVTNVDKSIYDATTNQLFVYDYVKPLSCWNTSTGKKIWMYQTPLIPAKPSYGCGNLYRDSLVR